MLDVLPYFAAVGGVVTLFFSGMAFVSFLREKEKRALRRIVFFFLIPGILLTVLPFLEYTAVNVILLFLWSLLLVFLVIPPFHLQNHSAAVPRSRIDERDIMFSRRLLKKGMKDYDDYYSRHPEYKAADDSFREKPGLLNAGAKFFDPVTFYAADALFETVEHLAENVDGEISGESLPFHAQDVTALLKNLAKKMGAKDAGITLMKPYHYYHTGGRLYNYGEPVKAGHKYGLAFTVEMNEEMMSASPEGPAVMESAHQYLESGKIAVVLARYIRKLGYSARAHIDGHYLVVCPLVARDAGLGEIGRMGLLMTPKLGPRVRIGVVTTDLPLVEDHYRPDPVILDFCKRCSKCSLNCPVHAIPSGDPVPVNGVVRWQIKQEACYTYWTVTGTDCGRCVVVCPYSHRDNFFHRIIRYGIQKSMLINRMAVVMDDFFYGKEPMKKKIPDWLTLRRNDTL